MSKVRSSSKKPRTKAEFVRSLPPDMPAKEVVAKARAAGLGELSEHYVHNIRSLERQVRGAPKRSAVLPPASERTGAGDERAMEELLRAVAAEIGLGRAIALLEDERRRVRIALGS
jgi:hypothetical protein